MAIAPHHRARVLGSPWTGVHGTWIDSARHYGRHWHATYGLGVVEQGAQRSASGQGDVEAFAGDLITTNPGEVHDGRPLGTDSRRWRMVYLEPQVVGSMGEVPADLALTRPVVHDARLGQALRQLLDRLELWNAGAGTRADALACDEALAHTCGLLLQRHATGIATQEGSARLATAQLLIVRDRLGDDPLDVPSLEQLATLAGLSKFQLLRQFQKVFGLTPFAWLLQHRAERARALIRDGAGLASAAASCGFADQSHMTRTFARHFGFTPGAWQQAMTH
ncbi:MAG TPA: AraC family transcriptional regulator [Ideonella sp.]|uniref:AraC family transcriptional regulator n=1 Tax=Ideonella sp. TaxID=1929293 RepID=UPI002E35F43C|nr:AraC family transcriptional regulator [Ideonella sp.]HEX5685583.1 AraC family transcriptional regulator [Ideonella sp.]